jgi:four helix bundle protein
MRDPERLEVLKRAAELAELTYRATRDFPTDERFGLTSQMRRAAVSVGSNLTEGCSRSTDNAFLNFVQIALGSCLELDYQAMIAQRLGFGDVHAIDELRGMTFRLRKMIARLTSAVSKRRPKAVPVRGGFTAPPGKA